MKKLKNIFAALSTLHRIPSTSIESSWKAARQIAASATMNDTGELAVPNDALALLDSLIEVIVAIAKDDEDKAAAPARTKRAVNSLTIERGSKGGAA